MRQHTRHLGCNADLPMLEKEEEEGKEVEDTGRLSPDDEF